MTKLKIRPASRHIFAIGRDLINNKQSALIELVKNAYDADSEIVKIKISSFKKSGQSPGDDTIQIEISDQGHGMTSEVIKTKWMVPSTDDKLKRKYSPKGRLMQGRKGLGRYASAILGDSLKLETISNKIKTSVTIDWNEFGKYEYLDEVLFEIKEEPTSAGNGTKLTITGHGNYLFDWNEETILDLMKDLRRLINPFKKESDFKIFLEFGDFYIKKYEHEKYEIQPIEVLDSSLYRLKGEIQEIDIESFIKENQDLPVFLLKTLKLKLEENVPKTIMLKGVFENFWSKKLIPESMYREIDLDTQSNLYCGKVDFDFRVFDLEPEAIEKIIKRGMDASVDGQEYTIQEAKRDISNFSGIGLFRENFKIRPYGDKGNDWLELDKRRVNDPSRKIGNNQIIGFVHILPEEVSHLEETSARSGLKENAHYNSLKNFLIYALEELEEKRFDYRERTGKSRIKSAEDIIKDVLSYSKIHDKLSYKLKQLKIEEDKAKPIKEIFLKEEEKRERDIEELRKIIARYQGQVTLGKIAAVVLHEGRRPLSYFKNQIPLISITIKETDLGEKHPLLELDLLGLKENGDLLIDLFNKIDPLAVKKRGKKEEFSLKKVIGVITKAYESSLKINKIDIEHEIKVDKIFGWKDDFLIIFGNLFDNSIYWLNKYNKGNKLIKVKSYLDKDKINIVYEDNGVGIDEEAIIGNKIFEPGYSTKPEGTGLGLSISGEAASRNGYELASEHRESGAYFVLKQIK